MKKVLFLVSLLVLFLSCKKYYYRVYSIKLNNSIYYVQDPDKYKTISVFYRLQIERANGKLSCSPIIATKVLVDTAFKPNTAGYAYSTCDDVILPLTLEYFYAEGLKDSTKVQWQTRFKPDGLNYVVQRSFDGAKFKIVAKVPLNEQLKYVYTDTVTKK